MSDLMYEVIWNSDADKLLYKRDRFTRDAIKSDFKVDPKKGAIMFDEDKHLFVTPVADKRYTVVWELDDQHGKMIANVRAVVPTQFVKSNSDLKKQVSDFVDFESNGEIKLY